MRRLRISDSLLAALVGVAGSLVKGDMFASVGESGPIVSLRALFRQPTVAEGADVDPAGVALAFPEALSKSERDYQCTDDECGVLPHSALTLPHFDALVDRAVQKDISQMRH